MAAEVDFYELLEVSRDADDGELKSAYRKLAMRFHPDKTRGVTRPKRNSNRSARRMIA